MRIDRHAHEVSIAQAQLKVVINDFQREHDLTDIELLQALTEMQSSTLKYMLRYERHGDYETPAMEPPRKKVKRKALAKAWAKGYTARAEEGEDISENPYIPEEG